MIRVRCFAACTITKLVTSWPHTRAMCSSDELTRPDWLSAWPKSSTRESMVVSIPIRRGTFWDDILKSCLMKFRSRLGSGPARPSHHEAFYVALATARAFRYPMALKTTLRHVHSRVPLTMICSRFALVGLVFSTSISLAPPARAQGQGDSPSQDEPASARPKVLRPPSPTPACNRSTTTTPASFSTSSGSGWSASGNWPRGKPPKEAAETYERAVPPGHRQ